MTETRRTWLSTIAVEFFLVVLGVLVAFQFDNWRSTRSDAQRAHEQLAGVREELGENQGRLAQVIAGQDSVVEKAKALLSIMDRGASVTGDSVSSLIFGAIAFHELEPVTSAYDLLISSGDRQLIRNESLMRRLAAFHGDLSAGFEDQANSVNLQHSIEVELAPYLGAVAPWRGDVGLPPKDPTAAAMALVSNDALEGLLFLKLLMEQNRLARYLTLAASVDSMLVLVEDELRQ